MTSSTPRLPRRANSSWSFVRAAWFPVPSPLSQRELTYRGWGLLPSYVTNSGRFWRKQVCLKSCECPAPAPRSINRVLNMGSLHRLRPLAVNASLSCNDIESCHSSCPETGGYSTYQHLCIASKDKQLGKRRPRRSRHSEHPKPNFLTAFPLCLRWNWKQKSGDRVPQHLLPYHRPKKWPHRLSCVGQMKL